MRSKWIRHLSALLCFVVLCSALTFLEGCSSAAHKQVGNGGNTSASGAKLLAAAPEKRSAVSKQRTYDHSLKLVYAKQFAVDYFQEGGCLITVCDGRQYYRPETAGNIPTDLSKTITVLPATLKQGYLAGTACMDYFASFDALGCLHFSSQREENWKIPAAAAAMHAGTLQYAGKYSAPDYELLTSKGCDLALENTMIERTPEVIEQLESIGIPVFIDNSSRESSPEARMEWVKLYGLLAGKTEAAAQAFQHQEQIFLRLSRKTQNTAPPTVAFFAVRANGTVVVRRPSDYIPAMIRIAGGTYAFSNLHASDDSNRSTEVISMETFYQTAKDADWLIYNASIEGERNSLPDLLRDAPVLADSKAVREDHVFCTTADLYQHSMGQGDFVNDLYEMMHGGTRFTYLFPLK